MLLMLQHDTFGYFCLTSSEKLHLTFKPQPPCHSINQLNTARPPNAWEGKKQKNKEAKERILHLLLCIIMSYKNIQKLPTTANKSIEIKLRDGTYICQNRHTEPIGVGFAIAAEMMLSYLLPALFHCFYLPQCLWLIVMKKNHIFPESTWNPSHCAFVLFF
jgi:hypothetical protein